ncbi:MAG: S9 family peptidase, partial [Chthoniobacterales bacterium]
MKRLSVAVLLLAGLAVASAKEPTKPFAYPPAPKSEQSHDYHGTQVADPYRPLEDADSEETKKWIEAENKLTFDFLAGVPERKKINERLTALWDYEKYGVPYREGGAFFFTKNTGLQNQSVLYTASALPGEPKALLDPNTLSKDGTTALTGTDVSKDGKLLAYGLAQAGSDWEEWKVREIESGKDRDDTIKWVKFSSASWNRDGSGFFYSRYDEPAADQLKAANYFHKLYFHRLGTPQSDDVL